MERRANYALVGMVTVGLTVGLFAFIVWLAGFSFNKHYDTYDVLFIGPVRGISEGGEVHFNGIKVGEVTKLSLDPSDPNLVIARVRLTAGVPVRVDSYAILEPQGITGVNYIQITGGAQGKPMLRSVTPRGQIPMIRSQKSTLADLLEGGGTVVQRAVETLDRVNRLLSDENIQRIGTTIQNFKSLSDELGQRRALIADAQKAIQDADETATSINQLAKSSDKLVNGDGKRALANLADAAEDLKQTSHQARAMLTKLDGPTSDFATHGLPQLTQTISSLEQTSKSLDGLARELQQSPQGVLGKAPAKELKVKP